MDFLTLALCLASVTVPFFLGRFWCGNTRHILVLLLFPLGLLTANVMVASRTEWQWAMPVWLQANYTRLNWMAICGFMSWSAGVVIKTKPGSPLRDIVSLVLLTGLPLFAAIKSYCSPVKLKSLRTSADSLVLQSTAASCAPAATANLLAQLGITKSEAELARLFKTSADGTLPAHIILGLRQLGFQARKTTSSISNVVSVAPPALLFFNADAHVVGLVGFTNGQALIIDPAVGRRRLSPERVSGFWTGHAIVIRKSP